MATPRRGRHGARDAARLSRWTAGHARMGGERSRVKPRAGARTLGQLRARSRRFLNDTAHRPHARRVSPHLARFRPRAARRVRFRADALHHGARDVARNTVARRAAGGPVRESLTTWRRVPDVIPSADRRWLNRRFGALI